MLAGKLKIVRVQLGLRFTEYKEVPLMIPKRNDRFQQTMNGDVPFAANGEKFEMKSKPTN